MYNGNLLKAGTANLQGSEKRVIDTNELVSRRLAENKAKKPRPARRSAAPADAGTDADGFSAGLVAETLEGVVVDGAEADGEPGSNIIKAGGESREIIAQAEEEAERILNETWARAKAEADKLREETMKQLVREREEALEEARRQGYSEGQAMAQQELDEELGRVQDHMRQKEAEYQRILDEMEPQFIEAITGIYEHIFHVELASYHDILVYLISTAMRKSEGNRDFLIHVSKEDFPYVSMQKKQICAGASPNCTVEIIGDITLSQNECMIETEGGIFDCGLGTQLEELGRKLRLLSYEK